MKRWRKYRFCGCTNIRAYCRFHSACWFFLFPFFFLCFISIICCMWFPAFQESMRSSPLCSCLSLLSRQSTLMPIFLLLFCMCVYVWLIISYAICLIGNTSMNTHSQQCGWLWVVSVCTDGIKKRWIVKIKTVKGEKTEWLTNYMNRLLPEIYIHTENSPLQYE